MTISSYRYLLETEYPAVRRVMQEDLQRLDDNELRGLLAELFPGTEPDDVENFMRSLQRFGRQAAPIAQRALPGIVQGAVQGGAVAGPYGALIGAIGGGAASLLAGGQGAPRTARPSPSTTRQRPATTRQGPTTTRQGPTTTRQGPTTTPGAMPTQGAAGSAALTQLLFLLSRPETMRALSSLLLSSSGRRTTQVGNQHVPTLAFANAISEMASEVVESYGLSREDGISEYLLDTNENPRGDLSNPVERAAILLADLVSVATVEAAGADLGAEIDDFDEFIDYEWIEFDDPLDTYEAARKGEHPFDD